MKCPRCQYQNPPAQNFCGDCGMPLPRVDGSVQTQSGSYPDVQQSLNEALARETATAEILRVIGSSPNDAQPVFETIARNGVSICAALGCAVF